MFDLIGESETNAILPFFHFDSSDSNTIAQGIACGLNILLGAFSDMHHLLATRQQPHMPSLLNNMFAEYKKKTDIPTELLNAYRECYWSLCDESYVLSHDLSLEYADIAGKLKGPDATAEGLRRSLQRYCEAHNYIGNTDINNMMKFLAQTATAEDKNYVVALKDYYKKL